jgi:subtilisin family serine protease
MDDNGHGTNVAGILASRGTVAPLGVAPGVQLVVVKVLDRQGRFSGTSQILAALDWIADTQPAVRIINMSLGTDARFSGHCDSQLSAARAFAITIGILNARGVTVVVSTGNSSSPVDVQLPSCIGRALAVAAVYDSDVGQVTRFTCTDPVTGPDRITCFSNSSSAVDLLAPGAPITATGLGGRTSTYFGTSMAAPHVVGAIAMLLEIDSRLTPESIELMLERTGRPVVDARNGLVIPRLDLFAAVSEARRPPSPRRRIGR